MDTPLTTPANLPQAWIDAYRRDGFIKIPGVITKSEAETFRQAALDHQKQTEGRHMGGDVFTQIVNVWRDNETMRRLTLHENLAAVASKLAGK